MIQANWVAVFTKVAVMGRLAVDDVLPTYVICSVLAIVPVDALFAVTTTVHEPADASDTLHVPPVPG